MKRVLALGLLASVMILPAMALAQEPDTTVVDELIVVSPAPLGGGVALNRLGETISTVGGEELNQTGSASFTDALNRNISGISVTDTQGNAFTGDVNYRGFSASPLQGLPQGLAVYLGGQRLNEAFGDTMNWDLIPQAAIGRVDLVTNNPAFGLNALGGALVLRTRDGFEFQGIDATAETGAFASQIGAIQGGWSNSTNSLYGAVDGGKSDGWRPESGSSVARVFIDVGHKLENGEIHFVGGVSNTHLGVVGPTPVDLLEDDRRTIFTFPQTTHNNSQFAAINGQLKLSGDWSVQGGVHTRKFTQSHVDGNDGDFERCASTGPLANTLCLEDDGFSSTIDDEEFQILDENDNPIPCPVSNIDTNGCRNRISSVDGPRVPYGTIDRTATTTTTTGVTFQLTNDADFSGRKNSLNIGGSYDSSDIHFRSSSTLGLITPDLEVITDNYPLPNIPGTVPGLGHVIHSGPDVAYGPADLAVSTTTSGLFASDTIDITPDLSLTLGGRYNSQDVELKDLTGFSPSLNSSHTFSRFNPAINLAWRSGKQVIYGGYSETNRAPTPLELGCSDPDRPCLLENSLVADPPLKQVTSRTWEVGGRGGGDIDMLTFRWAASFFNTENDDDIVSLASTLAGRGYFANVPKTRRTGYDAQVNVGTGMWTMFVGYSHVDATYEFTGLLPSPNNPEADDDGNIEINPGDHLGGIPTNRLKIGGDATFGKLTVGFDAQNNGSQFLVGDEGNDNDKLPSYWVAQARVDYAVTDKVSLFVRVENLFNEDFASFGTYFDEDGVAKVRPRVLPVDPEEQTLTLGAPRAIYFGLRAKY